MTLKCPNCGADLPSWWKLASQLRHFRIFECPNCKAVVEVRIRHEGLHRYVVTALLLILTGWVFLLEIFKIPFLIEYRTQVSNYIGGLSNSEKYTPPFVLAILILWYSARFGNYTLEIADSSAEKRRIPFIPLLVLFVPAAALVTAAGLYVYLAEGMNWFTAFVALLDVAVIIGLKKEREKTKKLEKQSYG
ncbi:hypothetical protein [Geoglobus acetivorans]|uniref:Uncharacterized protein n=1 Tax=Geoglobus acetivorans TaxID=565033 RepID=A0A0A7GBD3_GEOAI|nr:hypothetical protein GACE_0289 [Geoglobus acetivorans]